MTQVSSLSMLVVFCLCLLGGSLAFPGLPKPGVKTCAQIFNESGIGRNYADAVAHTIHSMTLSELRKYEPDATEINNIPMINLELSSPEAILTSIPNVPARSAGQYLTEDMEVLDMHTARDADTTYEFNGMTLVERIVHTFHMREIWAKILTRYRAIKNGSNKPSQEVCACFRDVDNNGIMIAMRKKAMDMRQPSLVFGSPLPHSPAELGVAAPTNPHSSHEAHHERRRREARVVQDQHGGHEGLSQPKLSSSKVWRQWVKILDLDEEYLTTPAIYFYCVLSARP